MSAEAICPRCAAPKEVPLARCAGCGWAPTGADRELALLCSTRLTPPDALAEVATRLRRGEPLDPSPTARERARALLRGEVAEPPVGLSPRQFVGLLALNVLLTPLVGWAIWFRWRTRPGPGAGQALLATAPVSIALGVAWWIA